MATGGVSSVLHGRMDNTHLLNTLRLTDLIQVVYRPEWVNGFGIFFCLLNIVFFLANCVFLSMRFYLRPGSLTKSFTDQVESLFIPAFVSLPILCLPYAAVICQGLIYSAIVRLVSSLVFCSCSIGSNISNSF